MLLREKDKQILLDIFQTVSTPIEIWAYGSRVNNTAHSGSDLDLVLRTQDLKALAWEEYSQLIENIKESNIPILVELRDWASLPKSFHMQIEKQYEVLYSSLI